jgi:RecA-family ATPase
VNDDRAAFEQVSGIAEPEPSKSKPTSKSELPLRLSDDEEWIPPRGLLGNTFCKKFLSGLISPGAVGKTSIRIAQALAVATGRELTYEKVFVRAPILFICMEDDENELRRRFRAAVKFFGIAKEELTDVYIWSIEGQKLDWLNNDDAVVRQPLYTRLLGIVKSCKIGLIIFDPFVKVHDVNENENKAIDEVVTILIALAEETNIAIDICHHARKGGAVAGDADTSRGASSLSAGGRLFRTVAAMTETEAKALGVPEEKAERVSPG